MLGLANRMSKSVQDRIEAVASSVYLAALSRLAVPLILAAVMWGGSSVLNLDKRMHAAEAQQGRAQERLVQLETHREADLQRDLQRDYQLREIASAIRSDIAALRSENASFLRSLTRVEQYIDNSNNNRRANGNAQ